MRAKDKENKHVKLTIKRTIAFLAFIIIILYGIICYDNYFGKNEVYAKETHADAMDINNIKISGAEKLDLDNIVDSNTKNKLREEYSVQEVELEYITKYQTNTSLPKGMLQVIQEGREGKQEITIKKTFKEGELIAEEQVGNKVTKGAVNKIVEVGGASYRSKYKVKVGDNIYTTSDRASVMVEPSDEAQKIATLKKGIELKVLEVQKNWYKVSGSGTRGYIKTESTTYINPNNSVEKYDSSSSISQNIAKLSFNMSLNKPSGFSIEQFKKVLTDSKDVNKIFYNNAEYFYYIEKQYNINGLFVAAVGIHESAWGTSKIALSKNNLFGYGAYDSNPYNGAYSFDNYSESIDLIARVFVKYYLNPKGTSIYGGEKAQATYYNGATLSGVNQKYATDKNWANGVYTHMKYLYNKL